MFSLNAKSNEDCKALPSLVGTFSTGTISTSNNPANTNTTTPKSKRATSFIRKKPPLERGLSASSALRVNKNPFVCKWR